MGAVVPIVGKVMIPSEVAAAAAGGVVGDVSFSFITTVRGGPVVAGGRVTGYVNADGSLVSTTGVPIQALVLHPTDETDEHPFGQVDISWRGNTGAGGYRIVVDLLVPVGATSVDIRKPLAPREIVLAGRAAELESLLTQAQASLPEVQQAGAFAATAADVAFGSIGGKLVLSEAELAEYRPPDGVWASIALSRFFRREAGAWVEHQLGAGVGGGGAGIPRAKTVVATPTADLLADAVRTFVIDLPANSFLKRYCAVLGMAQAQTNECEVKFYEAGDVGNPTAWDDMRYHAKFGTHGDQFLTTDTTEGPEYIDASGNKKLRVWAKNTGANTIQQFGLSIEIAYGG